MDSEETNSVYSLSLDGTWIEYIGQQALPLDHKYTASQYTGKSVDVYVLDTGILFTIITVYSMVELTIQDVIQLTS